ncbi:MAG: tRNA-dihydrouridine synthase family protein [Candidatus Gracilibacteria bacterium]|nr:tRNA-dihydrouridine synthase family protein [Candidatus Gracilibacteria bacterium]
MKDFWKKQIEKKGKLVFLAPMDGYGDSAYRQAMKRISPDIICVSEFYSADGLVHSKLLADSVLPHTESENPLIIQIFGKDPEMFAQAAKIISNPKYNIAGIDINMGCPAKKVVRSGHGSCLLINEQTAFAIVKAMNEATHLPISVKTRLSFDGNQDLINFVKGLEAAGASLVTIHGRTAKQAYTGKADFTNIYELKKHVSIPVICNGDIMNYDDGMKKVQNLDGIMIGRGSFGNPWCFLAGEYHPTLSELLDQMEFHALKLVETKGEKKGNLEIRKHLVQYLKFFPGVKAYRKRLVTTDSFENTQNILNDVREEYKQHLDKKPGLGELDFLKDSVEKKED